MRFLSLFSGIEAASVAWLPLGWQCAGFSEVEPFCCELLAQKYPDVPNLGDVRAITKKRVKALGNIDAVVFGFPCQDLSVAGKRKGLRHSDGTATRSGLFFDAMRIVEWSKARWAVAENVPGLFSSHGGRDFAAVVGEMAGVEFDVPDDGWRNTGMATGPRGLVEWCVLDAQWFGLAQRRKRVFIVRDSGDWISRPPLLLERNCLCGNPAPRREAGAGVANSIKASAGRNGGNCGDERSSLVAPPITSNPYGDHESREGLLCYGGNNTAGPIAAAAAVNTKGGGRYDFEPETFVTGPLLGSGDGTERPSGMPREADMLVAFDTTQITSKQNRNNPQPGDPCHPLASGAHPPTVAIPLDMRQASRGDKMTNNRAECSSGGAPGTGIGEAGDPAPSLADSHTPAVDYQCHGTNVGPMGTMRGGNGNETGGVPFVIKSAMTVRRLTPRECERLQGFPDDYTAITYRGKPAADGPRYRALGNSMAVPVMRWIGERIELIEREFGSKE